MLVCGLKEQRTKRKRNFEFFLFLFSSFFLFFFLIVEVSPDCAERLRGALRFSSCSHHVGQPGASAPIPPV